MSSKKSKKKSQSYGMNRITRDMLTLNGNPIWRAFSKVPISDKSKMSIGLSGRKSLYALTNGAGDLDDCKDLMLTAFAGIYLAEQGYGADLMDDFTAALATILDCHTRGRTGLFYTLDPAEASKVAILLDMHEQQLELADKSELSDAIVESYRRAGDVLRAPLLSTASVPNGHAGLA